MTTIMRHDFFREAAASACLAAALLGTGCAAGLARWRVPERTSIDRTGASRVSARLPTDVRPPPTVSKPQLDADLERLSLDDAIRQSLANSDVVRVLAGETAVASGRTIYDPAVSHTVIDQEQGRFDPSLDVTNTFNGLEQPLAFFDPSDPTGARIGGPTTDDYNLGVGLSKTTASGGTASLDAGDTRARFGHGFVPLTPQNNSSVGLGFTQPLLQGGGAAANLAPVVIARIQTKRSFFQFKDGMQEMVRGVVEAYWGLVFARTDVWARRQQVAQGEAALVRSEARLRGGIGSAAEVAQARLALANFNAARIGAEADLLTREAAFRNLLGVPPTDATQLVPVSPPSLDRLEVNWDEIVALAEDRRPDLIELKLIIEADEQFLVQARNRALPRVDALALYRWNGLDGETPSGARISTRPGEFTDWTLGVNFSVPLGLRTARAAVREQELVIVRDRANLDQGLHAAIHELANSLRNLDRFYEQYVAYRAARQAARVNLDQQFADYRAGRAILLNVLQAITDWGNSVSLEAQALTSYNIEQATLQRRTGTILETHGVYFTEERFGAVGPLGRLAQPRCYPRSLPPSGSVDVYPGGDKPAESVFDLEDPLQREETRPVEPESNPDDDLPEPQEEAIRTPSDP